MREGLLAASVAIGLEVMGELVEAEVSESAGPKGKHDPARAVYRHGSEAGRVTLGGRRVPVRRPRVRTVADDDGADREVRLESYDTFASVDLLSERMVASLLAGLSGRRYESGRSSRSASRSSRARRGRRRARSAAASSLRPRSGWPRSARARSTASGG
jgi:putative transposase